MNRPNSLLGFWTRFLAVFVTVAAFALGGLACDDASTEDTDAFIDIGGVDNMGNVDSGGDTVGTNDTTGAQDYGYIRPDEYSGDIYTPDACTCSTNDECCDGCHPINEDGACGDFANCLTKGVCTSGECVGGGDALACDSPATCETGEGVCNPETGECEYEIAADGQTCEAIDGLDGSGMCQMGECLDFGACDHRTYDQELGYACNFDSECASGNCMTWGDDWSAFCTRECGEGNPCPDHMFCVNAGVDVGRFCRPYDRDLSLPGDASQALYAVCNKDADCAGGQCLALNDVRFCSANCESTTTPGTADDDICGSCGECRDNGDDPELKFNFKFYCTSKGSGATGDPCAWGGDCMRRFCHSGLCSEQCLDFGGVSNCPEHMTCKANVLADPDIQICVPLTEVDKGFGDECVGNHSCPEGTSCMEILGKNVCTVECGEELPECGEGACTEYETGNSACLPESWIGSVAYGGACQAEFQCPEGSTCYLGTCLIGCESADDCIDMSCTLDSWYQIAYCSPTCDQNDDCPARMACVNAECVVTTDGQTTLFGACRSDADCRTGMCVGGLCSDRCGDDTPCESSVALPIPEWGLCKPCNPDYFGMDCDEDWGLSECIQDIDGAYFCATECYLRGEGMCPVGTACYSTGGYSAVCAPISGSCTMQGSQCSSRGVCSKPLTDTMPCTEDADCGYGVCTSGRCAGPECSTDDDCECDLLMCDGTRCAIDPDQGTAEVEPNDELGVTQSLTGEHHTVLGTLIALEGAPDIDLFTVPLVAGQMLDAWTSPFCNQYADTHLRFFMSNGTPLNDWVFDSMDPSYPFSILVGYQAEQDHDIIIEMAQGGAVLGNERVNYILDVNVFTPADNDTCLDAWALVLGGELQYYDLATANTDMSAYDCTGATATGKDMAFSVTVPDQKILTATAHTPFDSQVYLVADCADLDGSCLAGADIVWKGGPETLVYANETGADQDLVLVVDSFLPESFMEFGLSATLADIAPAINDTKATAIAFEYGTTPVSGSTVGANNTYDHGTDGCVGTALPGRDVVYYAMLNPGDFLTVRTDAYAGVNPVLWLTADPESPDSCLDVAQGMVHYRAIATTNVYLVIDGLPVDGYGNFDLTVAMGHKSECFGPCDAQNTAWSCVEGTSADLCWCDSTTNTLMPFDCNEYCVGDGALSGTCHSFTAPGHERDSCKCDYDCSTAVDHCDRGIYTNCSCASADPCGWVENGGCDEFCAIEYPADHFDDTVDCTTEE